MVGRTVVLPCPHSDHEDPLIPRTCGCVTSLGHSEFRLQIPLRLPVSGLYNRQKRLDYLHGPNLITWRSEKVPRAEDHGRLEEPGTALRYSQRENRDLATTSRSYILLATQMDRKQVLP